MLSNHGPNTLKAVGANILETHEIGWCASQLQKADDDRRLALNNTSESGAPDIATKSRIAQNNVTKCMKWAVQAAAESVQTSITDLVTKFSPDYSVKVIFDKMIPFLLWLRKDGQAETQAADPDSFDRFLAMEAEEAAGGGSEEEVVDELAEALKGIEEDEDSKEEVVDEVEEASKAIKKLECTTM